MEKKRYGIYKEVEIEVALSPTELAGIFCKMDGEDQALFFNALAENVATWSNPHFCFQAQEITDQACLTPEGRHIMATLGEYSSPSTRSSVAQASTWDEIESGTGPGPALEDRRQTEREFLVVLLSDPALAKIPSLLNLCCERAHKINATSEVLAQVAANVKGEPDRTHEGCQGCALQELEPAQCSGHPQGPQPCFDFTPKKA